MKYLYIASTIIFTVYAQLAMKWRMGLKGDVPPAFFDKIFFLIKSLGDIWLLSSFIAAGLAALSWMLTVSKFDLSFAYPFMSLSFVLVFFFSIFLFNEPHTFYKILGLALIILGVFISSRSV